MVKLAMREQAKKLMTYKAKVEGNYILVKASQAYRRQQQSLWKRRITTKRFFVKSSGVFLFFYNEQVGFTLQT
jgi:hypothetical protein